MAAWLIMSTLIYLGTCSDRSKECSSILFIVDCDFEVIAVEELMNRNNNTNKADVEDIEGLNHRDHSRTIEWKTKSPSGGSSQSQSNSLSTSTTSSSGVLGNVPSIVITGQGNAAAAATDEGETGEEAEDNESNMTMANRGQNCCPPLGQPAHRQQAQPPQQQQQHHRPISPTMTAPPSISIEPAKQTYITYTSSSEEGQESMEEGDDHSCQLFPEEDEESDEMGIEGAAHFRRISAATSAANSSSSSVVPRPTSLTPVPPPGNSGLSTPHPPEFSISPAESLSKASSHSGLSSSTVLLGGKQGDHKSNNTHRKINSPHSPSSLSVNFISSYPTNKMTLSPSINSFHSSLASSMNSLTAEVDQLERAIRHNDTKTVAKMLQAYLGKTVTASHGAFTPRTSLTSSSPNFQQQQQFLFDSCSRPVLKSQQAFDDVVVAAGGGGGGGVTEEASSRRASGSTTTDMAAATAGSSIFTNALHLAIEANAFDVCVLLLKNGLDPNESGVAPLTLDNAWRRSSHTSDESAAVAQAAVNNPNINTDLLNLNVFGGINLSTSREPLIRSPSVRTTLNSPMLLSPQNHRSFLHLSASSGNLHAGGGGGGHSGIGRLYGFSATSSPSSVNSDLSSMGVSGGAASIQSSARVLHVRSTLAESLRTVYVKGDGSAVTYDMEYVRERLFTLPPIFFAVAFANSAILRELLRYGAQVGVTDAHGVTPLHLCLCQEPISRACLHQLVQAGAKVRAKNNSNVAPFELVAEELLDEVLYLQKFIIDDAFRQLVPAANASGKSTSSTSKKKKSVKMKAFSKRETIMYANYKSLDQAYAFDQYRNSNSSSLNLTGPAAAAAHRALGPAKEESVDSSTSFTGAANLTKLFDFKQLSSDSTKDGRANNRQAMMLAMKSTSKSSGKEVSICLTDECDGTGEDSKGDDNVKEPPVPTSESAVNTPTGKVGGGGGLLNSSVANLLPNTISGLMGHKRSFAVESNLKGMSNNLSQSSLQLSSALKDGSGRQESTASQPARVPQKEQQQQQSQPPLAPGLARLFGRRRSGDCADSLKQSAKGLFHAKGLLSRGNTQDDFKHEEALLLQAAEGALLTLCRMSPNPECVDPIISCLHRNLPEMIKMNESANTISRLHVGLSQLFQLLYHSIVDRCRMAMEQLEQQEKDVPPEEIIRGKMKRQSGRKARRSTQSLRLTQEMTEQLSGLLVCVLHCLKGGQTFQYTSLSIINRIVDSVVLAEASAMPLRLKQVFNNNPELGDGNEHDESGQSPGSTTLPPRRHSASHSTTSTDKGVTIAGLNGGGDTCATTSSVKSVSALAAAAKHFRSFRLGGGGDNEAVGEALHLKQKTTAQEEMRKKNWPKADETIGGGDKGDEGKKLDSSRWMHWMRHVHLSPRLTQRKQLMINELTSGSSGAGAGGGGGEAVTGPATGIKSPDRAPETPAAKPTNRRKSGGTIEVAEPGVQDGCDTTSFVAVLIQEGLDLILNVLNNAITLQKRVSGQKQSCVPSKRSRNCIYHCLQIMSVRVILYASHAEEAQRRLINEGPLKVLIASIDSTHDPQLICLALQVIATLALNPRHQARLIEADLSDCLSQLILPSDEWFYTNHSTKYAKFVKHHAARIMVYLGLEKRLRNKVYLFDLLDEIGFNSPQSESPEDQYITQTSLAPTVIYSDSTPKVLIGSSVEGIVQDLIKQVEDKIINGDDSLCLDPLNSESYFLEMLGCGAGGFGAEMEGPPARLYHSPPAIQVDMPSGLIGDHRSPSNHPNGFFYLSTLPMSLQPIILLRVMQHRMFGCIAYWPWHSNAVSRASMASVSGSSIEFQRSRASSNASNVLGNVDIANAFGMKRNLACSNSSLSPSRIDIDRQPSIKSLPKTVALSNSLSTLGCPGASSSVLPQQQYSPNKLSIQPSAVSFQRHSLIDQQIHSHLQTFTENRPSFSYEAGGHHSPPETSGGEHFRFASLRRRKHSISMDEGVSSPPGSRRFGLNSSLQRPSDRNEADIMAFQRELQNLPKNESPSPIFVPPPVSQQVLSSQIASMLREAFERGGAGASQPSVSVTTTSGHPKKRPRSCSVPKITFDSAHLQLPGSNGSAVPVTNIPLAAQEKNTQQISAELSSNSCSNGLIRSFTSDVAYGNIPPGHAHNTMPSPSLSPIKLSRPMNESPISYTSTVRSASRSGSRSGSAGQVITESIIPNVHRAILKLLSDWVYLCPNDFKSTALRRELLQFLNRVSILGDHYRWLIEDVRNLANIEDKENLAEAPSDEAQINEDYKSLKKLILSGELPCSKEEAAVLAVIQLRVEETSPHEEDNNNNNNNMSTTQAGHGAGSGGASGASGVGVGGAHRPETTLKTLAHINDDKRRANTLDDNKDLAHESTASSSSALALSSLHHRHQQQQQSHHPGAGNLSSSFDELEEYDDDDDDDEDEDERPGSSSKDKNYGFRSVQSSPMVRSHHHHHPQTPQHQQQQQQHQQQARALSVSGTGGAHSPFHSFTSRTTHRILHWVTSNWSSRDTGFSTIDVRQYLPPVYHNTKNIIKVIKEQKRKLFHTSVYESEEQLKKLYAQTCRRLPAYGCRLFQVKELLHGRTGTRQRTTRLLGICLERIVLLDAKTLQLAKSQPTAQLQQWRTGGGRSHDRVVLEFRATKWSVVTSSVGSLRNIGTVLWEIMQDIDAGFLETLIAGGTGSTAGRALADGKHERAKHRPSDRTSATNVSQKPHHHPGQSGASATSTTGAAATSSSSSSSRLLHFREELQRLEAMLHFPEEVAHRLTEVEYALFYDVEPVHYIRQVTVDLSLREDEILGTSNTTTTASASTATAVPGGSSSSPRKDNRWNAGGSTQGTISNVDVHERRCSLTVDELIERFNEVSSWVTHIIISQPTHEMRKAALSCIMRVVQTCWNLGNFNSAVEILAGLKSEKLKPFWLSIELKDEPFLRRRLSDILLSLSSPPEEYRRAVIRALDIPHSKVVPFFGSFLRDLRTILSQMPSMIVLASEQNLKQLGHATGGGRPQELRPKQAQSSNPTPANKATTTTTTKDDNQATTTAEAKTQQGLVDPIADFNGEDHYMSRIGVGGIINIEKMYQTHQVLDNIRIFHIHAIRRKQLLGQMKSIAAGGNDQQQQHHHHGQIATGGGGGEYLKAHHNYLYQLYFDQLAEVELATNSVQQPQQPPSTPQHGAAATARRDQFGARGHSSTQHDSSSSAAFSTSQQQRPQKVEDDQLYVIDLDAYRPIQSRARSHGISLIPLDPMLIDYHQLQAMHHGMTTIHFEEESGRSSVVYLQLTEGNSCLVWGKPFWSTSLRSSGNAPQDYQLSMDIEEVVLSGNTMKYETKEAAFLNLDEGFIDLMYLKDVIVGQTSADLALIARRHSLAESLLTESKNCSIKLLFGVNLSDNRTTEFIAPLAIATIWAEGLRAVRRLLAKQKQLCDQRILWLKERYLQLYYEDSACIGPTPAEAIRVFGGRKWTIEAMGTSHHQAAGTDVPASSKAASSTSSKLRKKKSTTSLAVIRDYSTRSQLSISSEPESVHHSVILSTGQQHHRGSQSSPLKQSYKSNIIGEPDETLGDSTSTIGSVRSSSLSYEVGSRNMLPQLDGTALLHTTLLTAQYREKYCRAGGNKSAVALAAGQHYQGIGGHFADGSLPPGRGSSLTEANKEPKLPTTPAKHRPSNRLAITHSSNLSFIDFADLFRSFLICIRRDIKNIFEQIASKSDIHNLQEVETVTVSDEKAKPTTNRGNNNKALTRAPSRSGNKFLGLLTRNMAPAVAGEAESDEEYGKYRIFDAFATASIVTNSAGIDTLKTSVMTATDMHTFLASCQMEEDVSAEDVAALIQMHEPNPVIRRKNCLSFEGFARYLMDKNNFAYAPELSEVAEEDMDQPLSHYYIASSHNTYLTGHQLKSESSVELYSQVLLTGCRCVELDCWDGDDGMPLICHGHYTFTTKIPFKRVVEAINEKAFIASPYPVILSVENHCSLQQQAKMAQIFLSVFGEKLVTKFLFESDYSDDPVLPSPNQLKYRILIKNKKLRGHSIPSYLNPRFRNSLGPKNGRANSLASNVSAGSFNDDEDEEYDDDEDDDETEEPVLPISAVDEGERRTTKPSRGPLSRSKERSTGDGDFNTRSSLPGSPYAPSKLEAKMKADQIAPELSDLVIYCQAIKYRSSQIGAPPPAQGPGGGGSGGGGVGPVGGVGGGGGVVTANVSPTNTNLTGTPQNKKLSSASRSKALHSAAFSSTIQAAGASLLPAVLETAMVPSNVAGSAVFSGTAAKKDDTQATGAATATTAAATGVGSVPTPTIVAPPASVPSGPPNTKKGPNPQAPCYQISSINETTCKKLCRKSPLAMIAHTESQIMRIYPAAMRIDSSNFNPVLCWAFGIQSVALNYQTLDQSLAINTAMFEQNGGCGYVLKSAVMRDKSNMMFGRFNPYEKEFDGLHTITLTITIISGQYVCPNTNTGSPQVEVEIVGIPIDSTRQRTKIVQRNSLNPIWNDTFTFKIKFVDLAFLKISVTDAPQNHLAAQRVLPIKSLRQGYRHLRLHGPQNQPLSLSTLFVCSQIEEEGLEVETGDQTSKSARPKLPGKIDLNRLDLAGRAGWEDLATGLQQPVKRRLFFLALFGVIPEEPSTILKVTQDTTVNEAIEQALRKANKPNENVFDYVILEEVSRGWEKKPTADRAGVTQRILEPSEKLINAQSNWKGEGRFILKKLADDPSTRAWMTSIRASSANKERRKGTGAGSGDQATAGGGAAHGDEASTSDIIADWDEEEPENETFLVCIYNVNDDQPYTILKTSVAGSSQDVISQALLKAHRAEDPGSFVLVEEVENYCETGQMEGGAASSTFGFKSGQKGGIGYRRVVGDDENIYEVQKKWKNKGKFEMKYRKDLCPNDSTLIKNQTSTPRLLRNRGSFKKLSQIHRTYSRRLQRKEADSSPVKTRNRSVAPETIGGSGSTSSERPHSVKDCAGPSGTSTTTTAASISGEEVQRQAHSEGEMPSDSEDNANSKKEGLSSLSRLKKLSLKRLKVWKS